MLEGAQREPAEEKSDDTNRKIDLKIAKVRHDQVDQIKKKRGRGWMINGINATKTTETGSETDRGQIEVLE